MSTSPVPCLRCRTTMELGYLRDLGPGHSVEATAWIADEPERRWWGIAAKGHEKIPVTAWRCPNCGYLELRASAE